MSSTPTSMKVTLDGVEIEVKKLKAGKFYEAQKIFAEIISAVSATSGTEGGSTELDRTISMLSKFPEKIAKFVAFCMDMQEEDLIAKAYPEEITTAFGVCIELNNVIENLKNSVAPMEKLMGATKEVAKKA